MLRQLVVHSGMLTPLLPSPAPVVLVNNTHVNGQLLLRCSLIQRGKIARGWDALREVRGPFYDHFSEFSAIAAAATTAPTVRFCAAPLSVIMCQLSLSVSSCMCACICTAAQSCTHNVCMHMHWSTIMHASAGASLLQQHAANARADWGCVARSILACTTHARCSPASRLQLLHSRAHLAVCCRHSFLLACIGTGMAHVLESAAAAAPRTCICLLFLGSAVSAARSHKHEVRCTAGCRCTCCTAGCKGSTLLYCRLQGLHLLC